MKDFFSRPFNFRIYEEMLTRAQLLLKIRIINFVQDIVRINVCSFDRKSHAVCYCVDVQRKSREILVTNFTLNGNISLWGAMLFCNMTIQINLRLSEEIGKLDTLQYTKNTSLFVRSKINLCNFGSTFCTRSFFVAIEQTHFINGVWEKSLKKS